MPNRPRFPLLDARPPRPALTEHAGRRRALRHLLPALVVAMLAVSPPASAPTARAADDRATFAHVLVMVLENQRYEDVVGSPDAPFINEVLERHNASATRFFTPFHNSPSDYYALVSGKGYTKGDGGDWGGTCLPSMTCSTDDPSVFQQLNEAGKMWKTYSEDQDSNCQSLNAKKYWVGHNPAIYYRNLGPNSYIKTGNGSCATSDVPYSVLSKDLAANTVPEFALLIPNNCNNMHDKCAPLSNPIKQGDTWLAKQLTGDAAVSGGLIAWAKANDTLLIITFDESHFHDQQFCCTYAPTGGGGHVPTWVIGPTAKVRAGGFKSNLDYSLYSILRTVEENFSLPLLGHAADAVTLNLNDFFPSRLELDHGSGVSASAGVLAGKDFAANELVSLLWNCGTASCPDGRLIGSVKADAKGAFKSTVSMPSAAEGTYALGARGLTSGLFGYAPFTIRAPLAIAPTFGAHGEQAEVSGAGFGAKERVVVYWDCPATPCPASIAIGSARTDGFGAFDPFKVVVPVNARKGAYAVQVVGDVSHKAAATRFQVTEAIALTPTTGVASSTVRVSGWSFGPNEHLDLVWDCRDAACNSTTILGSTTTDANGDFRAIALDIPKSAVDGNFAIGARGATAFSFARDWFKVKQPISVFPTSGPPGKGVSISAAGFDDEEEVDLFWNCDRKDCPGGTSLGTSIADGNGELSSVQAAIPDGVPGGTYHVAGLGTVSGKFVTTPVSVTPQVRISPARGANGWTANLSGSGFLSGQQVEILWDCDDTACTAPQSVATAATDGKGGLTDVRFKIPATATVGPHSITARVDGKAVAVSSFSVETALSVSPKKGGSGWNATIVGTGFGRKEPVSLLWDCTQPDCSDGQVLRSMQADQNGAFEVKVRIPSDAAPGDHGLAARGDQTKVVAFGTYSVVSVVASDANGDLTIMVVLGGVFGYMILTWAILRRRRRRIV